MDPKFGQSIRLSDRILFALDLAIEQGDLAIADQLFVTLEKSLTRGAGGDEFVERRSYSDEYVNIKERLDALRDSQNDGVASSVI